MIEEILGQILGLSFLTLSFVFLFNKKALKVLVKLLKTEEFLVITGSLFIVLGVIVISLHNIWSFSWPVLITLSGWLLLIEGLYRLLFIQITVELVKEMDSLIPIKISLFITLIIGGCLTLISFF